MVTLSGKRPYEHQIRAYNSLRSAAKAGKRRIILTIPTGGGKTFVAAMLIKSAAENQKKTLFLGHRRELLFQAQNVLRDFGVQSGMILAGEKLEKSGAVSIASKGTLAARSFRSTKLDIPSPDLMFVDEAHLSVSDEYLFMVNKIATSPPYPLVVGLTATPSRKSGRSLGDWWDALLVTTTYKELRDKELIVPSTVYAPYTPDMNGVKAQDWDKEACKRMNKVNLVGDIYSHWLALSEDRPTVIFASGVQHSRALEKAFRHKGVACDHIDGGTPADMREEILDDLACGNIQVVMNCDVLSEGWDQPGVSCIVLAAPTRSLVRYRQRSGRALRPYKGKDRCIIIDHAGCVHMHLYPDEDIPWTLDRSERVEEIVLKRRDRGELREPKVCLRCFLIHFGSRCPKCGTKRCLKSRQLAVKRGLLRKIKRSTDPVKHGAEDYKRAWFSALAVAYHRSGDFRMAKAVYYNMSGKTADHVNRKVIKLPYLPEKDFTQPVAEACPFFARRKND